MMDGVDLAGMTIAMLIGSLILIAAVGAAVYFGMRMTGPRRPEATDSARALLDRRLAAGEIEPEDYYERESALRTSQPLVRARRHP